MPFHAPQKGYFQVSHERGTDRDQNKGAWMQDRKKMHSGPGQQDQAAQRSAAPRVGPFLRAGAVDDDNARALG